MSILTWIEDKKRLKVLNAPKHSANSTDSSKGLWTRCDKCGVILYIKHLKENQRVCFSCSYHLQMMSGERIENLLDKNEPYGHANALPLLKKSTLRDAKANASNLSTWRPLDETVSPCDPLKFHDQKAYTDRLQDAQERTGLQDAIQTGTGMIDGIPVALAVMDFSFMGGSMGSVVGEKITRLIEYATGEGLTLLIVSASGGARMQEGVFSLMQMAKISSALQIYQSCAKLLYISILTSPTTGGVTASFAMLGDIIFAEPKALIAFAGRRVIEQTLCEDLPDDFQTSEYMLHHGLVDLIVPRRFLRQALSETIRLYQNAPFKKRGHIPFGVQNPITFLTEEKIRRGWSGLASPGTKVLSSNSSYFKANQNQNFNRLSLSNQSGSITKKFVTGSDKSELFKAKPKRMYREILTSFEIMLALFVSGNTKKQNASLQKTAPEKPLGDLSSSFTKRQTSEELGQIPTSFPRSTSTNRRFALRSKVSLRSPSNKSSICKKEERRFVQPQRKQTQSPFWLYNNLILRASSTVDNKKFFNYQFISGQYRKNQPLYLILKNDFVSYTKQGFNLEEGIPSSKSLPTIFKSKLFLQNQGSKESSFYGNKAVAFTEGDRKNFVSSFCFASPKAIKSSICKPSAKPENQQSKTNSRFVAQRGKGKTIFDPKDKGYKYKSSISTTSVKINQNANRLGFCKSEASNFLSPSGIVAKANLTNSHKKAKNIAGESLQTTRFTWKNENGNVPTMESVSEKAFATQNRKALFSLKNRLSLSKFKEHSSFSKLLGIAFTKPCFFNFSQKDCKFLLFKRFLTSLKLASTHKSLAKNRLDLQQYDTSAMLSQNGAGKRFAPKSVGFSKFFETKLDSLSIRSVSKKNAPSRVLAQTTRILKNKQAKPSVRLKQRFVQQVLFDFGFYCSSAIKNANDKYTFVPHAAKKKSFREIYQSEGQTTLSSSNKSSKSLYPEKIREQNSAGINGEMPSSSLLYNFRFLAEATLESNGLQISNEDQSVGQGEPIISSERHIEQKTQAVQKQAFYGGEKKVNLIPGLNDTRFNRSAIGFKHTNYLCERALSFLQNKSKAHKGLDKKQSLMTPKSNTKISASSSLSSDFSRNPKNISSVFFISRSHFDRINIKSNSKNCSAASPIASAVTKKGFKLGGSLGHANQNPNGLGFENQKTNQTININKSLSTAKKVSVTDFTSAENDIDFLNQAIELAATESVEWRAFYIHQQLSENTGFVDDFLQQEGVGKISKLDFLEPWFEKAGSTVGSEEPDFENQKGLDFLNLSGSEPRMSDNDTSFAARKQMGNVLFYKSLCRSKNLFSS